jgi:hypothetical protein
MVLRMTGAFIAHETVRRCRACGHIFTSDALRRLVTSRCNVGYDVLVFVGRTLFQRHCTTQEVLAELSGRGLRLSASEVEHLGRKFIMYLALGHRLAAPRIRQAMTLSGGYVLHLDATHEGDAPALMTSIDSLSRIVLANVKISSEHTGQIAPFLKGLQETYGRPIACVHDMGSGICRAIADVFPGTPDFVCHFHFLRDIGKDFLEPAYSLLRKRLRLHAMSTRLHSLVRETRQNLSEQDFDGSRLTTAIKMETLESNGPFPIAAAHALALWCLQGKHIGDGYGFPFDRPLLEFTDRLLELNRLFTATPAGNRGDNQPLLLLMRVVAKVAKDSDILRAVKELRFRCEIFDRLRKAMRIAPLNGGNGLNDEGTPETISTIRQEVEKFRLTLDEDSKLKADKLCRKMGKQIDKYGNKLFADPIDVDTPNGKERIYPQRTNNILEQFFRELKREHRRKTGNDSMCRTLQTMLADTPLVKNLEHPEYMKIFLNGKAGLEELFAEIGSTMSANNHVILPDTNRMLPGIRTLISLPGFPEKVVHLLAKQRKK